MFIYWSLSRIWLCYKVKEDGAGGRRKGCHLKGHGQAWEVGLREPHEIQGYQVQGVVFGLG